MHFCSFGCYFWGSAAHKPFQMGKLRQTASRRRTSHIFQEKASSDARRSRPTAPSNDGSWIDRQHMGHQRTTGNGGRELLSLRPNRVDADRLNTGRPKGWATRDATTNVANDSKKKSSKLCGWSKLPVPVDKCQSKRFYQRHLSDYYVSRCLWLSVVFVA